tara:strand:+ start:422 stop:736 length:315 start_codon:yes stop_codon:yes gene_type:complete
MKQQQMLILGIVMLMIFMVMMPTHKQQSQTVSAADIAKYSKIKECKKQKCKDLGGNLIGPGKEQYLKENFNKWCWKKDSACLWGDCNKCCSRNSSGFSPFTYCT